MPLWPRVLTFALVLNGTRSFQQRRKSILPRPVIISRPVTALGFARVREHRPFLGVVQFNSGEDKELRLEMGDDKKIGDATGVQSSDALISSNGEEGMITDDLAERVFESADKNGDGVLCKEEFTDWLKGNEVNATDVSSSRVGESVPVSVALVAGPEVDSSGAAKGGVPGPGSEVQPPVVSITVVNTDPGLQAGGAGTGPAEAGAKVEAAPAEAPSVAPPVVLAEAGAAKEAQLREAVATLGRPFLGVRQDLARRAPFYASDWRDGLQPKTLSAVLLLYVACLAPTVSFGGLTSVVLNAQMGVPEFLISHGLSGMIYACISGQPMTFIAPTGLTMAFTAALYRFTELSSLPFLATYGWVGLWTSGLLTFTAVGGGAKLIKFATTFTDDVFNALLALNFLWQAVKALGLGFILSGPDKTSSFLALNLALLTCYASLNLSEARRSKFFNKPIREGISDFGPILVIAAVSLVASLPALQGLGISTLSVPAGLQLAGGRDLLLPLLSVPVWARWCAALPGLLLAVLFYLDHLISVRVVNAPRHRMTKGEAYNQDLLALGLIVGLQSMCGLPWMCGATVQSLNHIRAMASYGDAKSEKGTLADGSPCLVEGAGNGTEVGCSSLTAESARPVWERLGTATTAMVRAFKEAWAVNATSALGERNSGDCTSGPAGAPAEGVGGREVVVPPSSAEGRQGLEIVSMVETRLSGFLLHALIAGSVFLLPALEFVPMPVIYGIFLYLGTRVLKGNEFLGRVKAIFYDEAQLPPSSPIILLGRKKVAFYIGIQGFCLGLLWTLKSFKPTAILFPSVIGGLVLTRRFLLPRVFKKEELEVLDAEII